MFSLKIDEMFRIVHDEIFCFVKRQPGPVLIHAILTTSISNQRNFFISFVVSFLSFSTFFLLNLIRELFFLKKESEFFYHHLLCFWSEKSISYTHIASECETKSEYLGEVVLKFELKLDNLGFGLMFRLELIFILKLA